MQGRLGRVGIAVATVLVAACGGSATNPVSSDLAGPDVSSSLAIPTAALPASVAPAPVSESRSGSGIPTTLDGEPVYVGLAAVVHARETKDASTFLVGGWFGDGQPSGCSGGITPVPALLGGCETVVGADSPSLWFAGPQGQMFWGGEELPDEAPPSIVRVHTHDARAADCSASQRTACLRVMAVEQVVWSGDAVTRAAPLGVAAAVGRLRSFDIISEFPMSSNGILSVERRLALTPTPKPCESPWPSETFAIRSDPRFGVIAVFPDAASRTAAEHALDPAAVPCGLDSRIARPGAGRFVSLDNVLVLVYSADVADHVAAALADPTHQGKFIPLPDASLDESLHYIDDAEALRLSGDLETLPVFSPGSSTAYGEFQTGALDRWSANALSYVVDDGQPADAANVPAAVWKLITPHGMPGTARRFVVHHPDSSDPALATEVLVAYELKHPDVDSWQVILVSG